uniref:Uncharacterized protein n=1 Tax=Rhizochromulina marina TaxID=1034831 RepID=A0A7S2W0V9_9STRA
MPPGTVGTGKVSHLPRAAARNEHGAVLPHESRIRPHRRAEHSKGRRKERCPAWLRDADCTCHNPTRFCPRVATEQGPGAGLLSPHAPRRPVQEATPCPTELDRAQVLEL